MVNLANRVVLSFGLFTRSSWSPLSALAINKTVTIFYFIYRSLGHNARFESQATTETKPLGAAANTVESTQIDKPAGECKKKNKWKRL